MDKKKIIRIVIVCCLGLFILGFLNRPTTEQKIYKFVEENESELEEIAINYLNGDVRDKKYKFVEVDGVFTNPNSESIVQFFYKGTGIVPACKYYGFYYSPTNKPVDYQNCGFHLEEDNGVWSWHEGNSDNGGITKKISDCWYYYEAWF